MYVEAYNHQGGGQYVIRLNDYKKVEKVVKTVLQALLKKITPVI